MASEHIKENAAYVKAAFGDSDHKWATLPSGGKLARVRLDEMFSQVEESAREEFGPLVGYLYKAAYALHSMYVHSSIGALNGYRPRLAASRHFDFGLLGSTGLRFEALNTANVFMWTTLSGAAEYLGSHTARQRLQALLVRIGADTDAQTDGDASGT